MLLSVLLFVGLSVTSASSKDNVNRYEPTWDSLDARPLPAWYDEAKVGIFIHWGVFSVPSFQSEWFWMDWITKKQENCVKFMKDNYPPGFTYQNFGSQFTAEFFDPNEWAEIFNASGAKYVVLTSKHHDGFTLWPSKYSYSWNAMDVGPGKDLVGSLKAAIKNQTDLRFGLYHSLYEWYNPLWLSDKSNNFSTNLFSSNKILPEMTELVNTYEPELIWSDGEWEASDDYWFSKPFLAWLYNDSPVKDTIVVNDRWGHETLCKHGGFFTCSDRYNPGKLVTHKWENAMTIDSNSWGFRRNAKFTDYLTSFDLIKELVTTVSCGGNLLVNVGPTKEGIIAPIFQDRLRNMGDWLQINGEAIYKSKPWIICQNDTRNDTYTWYTTGQSEGSSSVNLYAMILKWPSSGKIVLMCPKVTKSTVITMLGVNSTLQWKQGERSLTVTLPDKAKTKNDYAWTLKIDGDFNGKPVLENNVYVVTRLE